MHSESHDALPPDPFETPANAPVPPGNERRQNLIAAALLSLCLLTGVGNWVVGVRDKAPAETSRSSSSLTSNLFQEKPELGIILVEGTIMHEASSSGFGGGSNGSSDKIIAAIRQAEADGVKGLLFKINSPGGTASASQAVYKEMQRVRKESKIKIVAAMGDVAASGGYYIASAADKIYANPATLTGSIGVIAQFTKIQGLFDKVGLETTVIKSGAYKDIGSPYRDTSAAEREILQKLIDDTYQDFLKAVSEGRKMPLEQVRKLADGRIYTGNQAHQHKLLDALGSYQDALSDLQTMTQTGKKPKIKEYSKASFEDVFSMLGTQIRGLSPTAALEQITFSELRHLNKVPLTLYY